MSGFPVRPGRTAFGPKPENRRKLVNPAQQMDGPTVADLLFWQTAGMGVVSPVAWVNVPVKTVNGVVVDVAHAEAWNPNNDPLVTAPVVTRTALGVLTVQYAATYADKDGTVQNLALLFADPTGQGLGAAGQLIDAYPTKVDARTFSISLFRRDTGLADDGPFACLFW